MPLVRPLTVNHFRNNIVTSLSFNMGALGTAPILKTQGGGTFNDQAGTHFMLTGATTVTYDLSGFHAQSGGTGVRFHDDNGVHRAVYLPFYANNIASAVIPAAGVNHFFTDALSGCAIFIDSVSNGDLIVYHANAMAHTPNMAAVLANPGLDRADSIAYYGAMNTMAQYHQTALGQRAGGGALAITPRAHLHRNVYMQCIDDEIARKQAQGRTNVAVAGAGTNVVGIKVGGLWQFWWQTWAVMTYRRPGLSLKAVTSGRDQGLGPARLLGAGCFWRQ